MTQKVKKMIVITIIIFVVLLVYVLQYWLSQDKPGQVTDLSPKTSINCLIGTIDEPNIEYLTWPEYGNRSVLRSQYNNIAFTWGHQGIMEQFLYDNIVIYNLSEPEDYFCTPDDYIFVYNNNSSYRVKAVALNWTDNYKLLDSGDKAMIKYVHYPENGFNQYANTTNVNSGNIILSNWSTPPLLITEVFLFAYNRTFIPEMITVRNNGSEPLRVLYVCQDGAQMTSMRYGSQVGVHQYWADGDYPSPRVWEITDENRNSTANWVGMYDDEDGGMFAGIYAPSQSDGVRFHATWATQKIGIWAYIGSDPDVYNFNNLMLGVDTPNNCISYNDAKSKMHGTLIDFGVVNPGEEKTQSIVLIMFTGYANRTDMKNKINSSIQNITDYYDSGQYLRELQA